MKWFWRKDGLVNKDPAVEAAPEVNSPQVAVHNQTIITPNISKRRVIGYSVYPYGLSNQKLALLGLFVTALEQECAIALPSLCNFSTAKGSRSETPFREVFDIESMLLFSKDIGVEIVEDGEVEILQPREMFLIGSRANNSGMLGDQSLSAKFWRALRTEAHLGLRIDALANSLFRGCGIQAVVQLRIEPDWQAYVSKILRARNADDVPTTYQEILARVARTLGNKARKVLLTCDEAQVPVTEIIRYASAELNMCVFFKGGFLANEVDPGELFVRSIIDFELSVKANVFVGTNRSTFANTLFSTKIATQSDELWSHYIYTTTSESLILRETPQSASQQLDPALIQEPYISIDKNYTNTIRLLLRAHVGFEGDKKSTTGWIRPLKQKRNFQGFSITPVENVVGLVVAYRARLSDATWSEWASNGSFVGTHGKHQDLTGFSVRLDGPNRLNYVLELVGKFTDASDVVISTAGQDCISRSGVGFLCGMQIILHAVSKK